MPADTDLPQGLLLLDASGVTKAFGGLVAVNRVDFTVPSEGIVSLIGPNGAGKTTFFNMIAGLYRPNAGTIKFGGRDITGLKPHTIARLGIARTFQSIRIFANMSVLENVLIGMHGLERSPLTGVGLVELSHGRSSSLASGVKYFSTAPRLTASSVAGFQRGA